MEDLIKLGKKLFPLNRSLTGNGNVKTIAIKTRESAAKNFPPMSVNFDTGDVRRLSIVPERFSSDQERIVSAETKKIRSIGNH